MSTEETKREGGCRCGAVRFAVSGAPMFTSYCHCLNCRLAVAAPITLVVGVPDAAFAWTKGEDKLKYYKVSDKFGGWYCADCAGWVAQKPVGLPFTGTIAVNYDAMRTKSPRDAAQDPFFKPVNHVNYENRLFDVVDDLPKFLDFPAQIGGSGRLA